MGLADADGPPPEVAPDPDEEQAVKASTAEPTRAPAASTLRRSGEREDDMGMPF
jgi:hypothetical protein